VTEIVEARALAMVLLASTPKLSGDVLADAWRSAWPDAPELTGFDEPDEGNGLAAMTFTIDGMTAALAIMPTPIPGGELDGPAAASWLWPKATEDIERVAAHVIVSVSGPGKPAEAHLRLTRLVSAVIKATDALGVYMGSAGQVIKADVFAELAHVYEAEQLPVLLWISLQVFVDDDKSSLFTVGMGEFGLMDLEIAKSSKRVGQIRELAMNLATYLIVEGPVIGDGHTVTLNDDEIITVRHGESMIDRPGPVYAIEGF
jgi:hypothetical protein